MDCERTREWLARLLLDARELDEALDWLLLELYVAVVRRGGGADFCCFERRFLRDDFSGIAISRLSRSVSDAGGLTTVRAVAVGGV